MTKCYWYPKSPFSPFFPGIPRDLLETKYSILFHFYHSVTLRSRRQRKKIMYLLSSNSITPILPIVPEIIKMCMNFSHNQPTNQKKRKKKTLNTGINACSSISHVFPRQNHKVGTAADTCTQLQKK